jgi:G:T-mismatch repair DNA endonuclease (very short patch repair protein)
MEKSCYSCGKLLKTHESSHLKKCCHDIEYKDARYNQLLHEFKKFDLSYDNISRLYLKEEYSLIDFKKEFGLAYKQLNFLLDYYKIDKKSKKQISIEKNKKYQKTCLKKYGMTHSTTDDVITKIKKSHFELFGVDNIFKNKDFIKYSIKKKKEKYGKAGLGWIYETENSKEIRIKNLHNNLKKWWLNMDISEKENRISILKNNRFKWWENLNEEEKYNFLSNIKNNYESKLEKRISLILDEYKIKHKSQYWINRLSYDLQIDNNVIEINGDFWHCNPNKYSKDYIHPYLKKTSKDIWLKDTEKKLNAEKYGFNVIYIWEDYINKNTDEAIFNYIKKFIK